MLELLHEDGEFADLLEPRPSMGLRTQRVVRRGVGRQLADGTMQAPLFDTPDEFLPEAPAAVFWHDVPTFEMAVRAGWCFVNGGLSEADGQPALIQDEEADLIGRR